MQTYSDEAPINIGCGEDVSIADLAEIVRNVVGYEGRIVYDSNMPDGSPRKLLDVSRLRSLGWSPKISLREGIASTYAWFKAHE
jgi:GDP-L-fucose synthase